MAKYIALLRGINVGGNNSIKMTELRACFESLGFKNVSTYIQSGNVIFEDKSKSAPKLTTKIEKTLSKTFSYNAVIVVVPHKLLETIVKKAPKGFGSKPDKFRYDVIFLKPPLTSKEASKDIPTKEGVDIVIAGKQVIYFSRLTSKATQSRISRIVQLPLYPYITIRNWNTTTKLLALIEK